MMKRQQTLIVYRPIHLHQEISPSLLLCNRSNRWPVKRYASTNESMVYRGWRKFTLAIKTFMTGTKALYKDVKVMYEVQSVHGGYSLTSTEPREIASGKTTFPLSRSQLQFSYNVSNYNPGS